MVSFIELTYIHLLSTSDWGFSVFNYIIYNHMTLSEIKCRTITITEQLQLQLNYATMHIKQFLHFKNLSIHRKQFSHFKT